MLNKRPLCCDHSRKVKGTQPDTDSRNQKAFEFPRSANRLSRVKISGWSMLSNSVVYRASRIHSRGCSRANYAALADR